MPHLSWLRKIASPAWQLVSLGGVLGLLLAGRIIPAAGGEIDVSQLPPAASREVDFTRDVQPLLAAHCVKCHGPKKQAADLRLDTRTAILKGGQNGPAAKTGKSGQSSLVIAASQLDSELVMPPDGDPLTDEQVGLLRAWIDQGAHGPEDAAARRLPWSFQSVQRPDLPGTSQSIDTLVSTPLRDKQLTLSPEADRRTLIRRLYLVMHGLPPTPAEVEQFINDKSPDAYDQLVDRVLASPHYGERWARHWLDVVRFAESNGFETNRVRQNAWPYRDYVIQAFNEDLPYDRFIREQIAGDALQADAATGFLVAGAYDLVKSPDINLTLMQRQDELADIVSTTGIAFLGLTLGCARCHEHKFDPIPQEDYYAIQAVFAGVNFGPRPWRAMADPSEKQQLAAAQQELGQLTTELDRLRGKARAARGSSQSLRVRVNSKTNEEKFAPVTTTAVRFTILATNGSEPCLDELEIYDAAGENVALATTGTRPSASGSLAGYEIHKLEHIHDGRIGNERSWISNESGRGWVQLDFPEPRTISRIVWGRDRNGRFQDRVAIDYRIEAATADGGWQLLASSADREPFGPEDPNEFVKHLPPGDAAAARQLLAKSGELQTRITQLTEGVSAWLGTFTQPEPVHRLYRGDPTQKREVITPGALSLQAGAGFPGTLGLTIDTPEQQRRVKLADWIASPHNPLTPRVLVNRLWLYIFGHGIVDTPGDFGGNGALPTNPALLDWLADEFVRSGWSVKHMQRLILKSRSFRQSSEPHAAGLAADADARLLWRFPPRRLEAEAIRDCVLATSGALNDRQGGPGFFLQVVEVDNVYRYFPKEEFGPDEFRRMVYLNRIRQEQDSVFGAFDCPSGNQVIPRRSRSNTPLQALNLFNSPFVLQQAELFAARLRQDAGDDPAAQVRRAFALFAAREPDERELSLSQDVIREFGLSAFCRAIFNTSEFLFVF